MSAWSAISTMSSSWMARLRRSPGLYILQKSMGSITFWITTGRQVLTRYRSIATSQRSRGLAPANEREQVKLTIRDGEYIIRGRAARIGADVVHTVHHDIEKVLIYRHTTRAHNVETRVRVTGVILDEIAQRIIRQR